MKKINFYSHLSKEDKVHFSMDETAKEICELNYGDQRMLIAILQVREKQDKIENGNSEMVNTNAYFTKKLRELLELGFY